MSFCFQKGRIFFYLVFSIVFQQFIFSHLSFAQAPKPAIEDENPHQLKAQKLTEKIVVDGDLSEEIWQNSLKAGNFFQNYPFDSSFANSKTEVMVAYDEKFIYLAFVNFDKNMDKPFVVQSLKRDFDGSNNDFVTTYLDPFGDGTNGFTFGLTPYGVQREALMTNGGEGLNGDWDNKWYGESKKYDDRWTCEMAIPFKSIRYKGGSTNWKINFARIDYKNNESSSWKPVPRNFRLTSLAFTGDIVFEEPLPHAGPNVVLIPFTSGAINKNYNPESKENYKYDFGGDAKIGITSSLNLDLTANPDFSQVEVDRQVTNLDRFEIFYPERRQFFLENADLFSSFGFSRIRPFFSRRIGIAYDTIAKRNVQTPILVGARLSGKLDKNWRIGFLNMQTMPNQSRGIYGQNYTVATFQRKLFARSNIGAIFVNRQATSDSLSEFKYNQNNFNRVIGLDYNLASKDNKWNGRVFYHQMFNPTNKADQYAHASYLGYRTPKWEIIWNHEYVGANYIPEVGFVPRRGHWRLEPSIYYKIYPKKPNPVINNHGPQYYTSIYWDTKGRMTDQYQELNYYFNFTNSANLSFTIFNRYTYLFSNFDPTNTDGEQLLSGTDYRINGWYAYFQSNNRKVFTYGFGGGTSGYYNGSAYSAEGFISYRIKPYGIITISANFNRIDLPKPYSSADLLLLGPRFDLTLSRKLFFTTFIQYNNQIDNINLNARLQWRYKPVSDLYIVYTDNYFPENLKVKDRAIVLKLTYWLNM